MQNRMKNHQLTKEQIENLLEKLQDCVLATHGKNGYPYALPMNYIYFNNKIYMHGLAKGQKIDNIQENPKVCVEIHEMIGLLDEDIEDVCDVNVEYESIVILGNAKVLKDKDSKREVLRQIVDKYTPQLSKEDLPEKMINNTGVIEIEIEESTGKYYK